MEEILLVEDDAGQARLAQRALERAGFQVTHVTRGDAGVARVRQQVPSFVLLDRGLPDGDGLDVLRTLRAEFPSLCVIMLTGTDDATVAVDAMHIGAWDYVVKRSDLSHLADLPLILDRNRERLQLLREREALHAAVRASEERFRELFDNASDAIFVCDAEGVLQQVNHAFVGMIGCSCADIEGKDLSAFLAPTSPTDAPGLRQRSLRSKTAASAEVHLLCTSGRTLVLELKTRPIVVDGEPRGFQAIGRDVTQRRQVDQMKNDFLAMITHDMKNPVGIIVGYTEILLNDIPAESEWRDMLVSIDSSARGLLHLIMNFLDLSKIEAGALQSHRVDADINDVLRHVVQYQRPLARAKRIDLRAELASVPRLQIDRAQMERVFVNIIGNAIKFTPPSGHVSVHTASHNGSVEVRVIDSGPGIPREQVPRLFAKYQRLSRTAQVEGTGLGLFIAKSMIDAHGGLVRVESAPDSGATFIVSLPLTSS